MVNFDFKELKDMDYLGLKFIKKMIILPIRFMKNILKQNGEK